MTEFKRPPIEGAPIVGVTGTYYTDLNDVRFEIALDTAKKWKELELPFVVVDGSPDSKVAGALRARGATVLRCLTTIQLLLSDGRSVQKNQCRHSNGVQKNWLAGCLSVR